MAGIDRVVKHYTIDHETGERTLNTSFNVFLFLNAIAYIINLCLIFTVGPFGNVSNTTQLLTSSYLTILTIDEVFFKVAWAFIITWQAFWVLWQIINPSERNCEGVVRAAYFYPFATALYAGYTISCRYGMLILACAFAFGVTGTLVGLAMSLNRFRAKIWLGYLLWQGPLTLHAAWMMVETMLISNVVFVRLDESWTIKLIIASISLLVLFVTAIAWLSSYPVDFVIPFVLMAAIGGIYIELKNQSNYSVLIREQDFSINWLDGLKYAVLAIFILILLAFILKVAVVLLYSRPKAEEERRKREESRVSVSITIDTGAADNNNNRQKRNKSKDDDRPKRWTRSLPSEEEYDGDRYDSPPSTPRTTMKKKKALSSSNNNASPKKKKSRSKNRGDRDNTDPSTLASDSPRTPRKKTSKKASTLASQSPRTPKNHKSPKTKSKKRATKDKSSPSRSPGTSTSSSDDSV